MEKPNALIVTFNCGRELAKPEVFAHHLSNALVKLPVPDLIILSLQEIAPIAHAFLGGSYLIPYLDRLRHVVHLATKSGDGASYVDLLTRNVGLTALMVFVREDRADRVRWMETAGVGVGLQAMGNKGAVGLRLGYVVRDEVMEMTFVSAHLAPMEDGLERRNEDWEGIVRRLVFTPVDGKVVRTGTNLTTSSDGGEEEPLLSDTTNISSGPISGMYTHTSHLVVAGDLNYRTALTNPKPEDYKTYPQATANRKSATHYSQFLHRDQLRPEMKAGRTCHGLTEAPIDFPPTYKYSDAGRALIAKTEEQEAEITSSFSHAEDSYPWANHRWPSWCDRILYLDLPPRTNLASPAADIKTHIYTSLPLMSTSDHRPVLLSLTLPLLSLPSLHTNAQSLEQQDPRFKPPFPIDTQWRETRLTARRKEVAVGILAYLGLTWEGNGVLLAAVLGAVGGWMVIARLLLEG